MGVITMRTTKYFGPTVLAKLDDCSHPTMEEEIFGPILPVLAYKNEDEIDAPLLSNMNDHSGFMFSQNARNSSNVY